MHKIINNLIMDDLDVILKVKVSNGKNEYTIFTAKDKVTIEEIKRECIKKFNLPEKEMNNISLLYKDEDNDINILTNNDELIFLAKEINPSKYLVNLELKLNNEFLEDINNKINDKKQEMNEINNDGKGEDNYNININEEKNTIIRELINENEKLKLKINSCNERIKHLILYYEEYINSLFKKIRIYDNNFKYKNEKIEKLINENHIIEQNKGKDIIKINEINTGEKKINQPVNKGETNNTILNNEIKETKKSYYLEDLEFINNKCNECHKKIYELIHKCVICQNYFLCDNCYKIRNDTKFHEHYFFFKIIFPEPIIKKIKIQEKNDNIINNFNIILRNYFFDKNGNLSFDSVENFDQDYLKVVCKEMVSIGLFPLSYFTQYQKSYINYHFLKLEHEKQTIIIAKISSFSDILNDYNDI